MKPDDSIFIPSAPPIPGLCFRRFRGESDFPLLVKATAAAARADQVESTPTLEDISNFFAHLSGSDPCQDMLFVECNGELIGYSSVSWYAEEAPGSTVYELYGFIIPEWRRKGIGRAVLTWSEDRLRAIAAGHLPDQHKVFQAYVAQGETGLSAMLARAGYAPIRYFSEMLRSTLDDIPTFPLPVGLEVRPVIPAHYRPIWEASNEAFRDHWGYGAPSEADYEAWLNNPRLFQPALWQVAWDRSTNEVAGQVRTYIDYAQNARMNRKRGFTEFISVRRPWRRQGLARALIALSLAAQKEAGMTESALRVDSDNLSGATRVYEDCGFRTIRRDTMLRKPL